MPQQTHAVSEKVRIEIRNCHNRVTVNGSEDAHTVIANDSARQDGDTLVFENMSKVLVRVPRTATVLITDCEADVRVDDLAGRVEITRIDGDIALRNLSGETLVSEVDGDLAIKNVLMLQGQGAWHGDVAIREVNSAKLEAIDGDLSVWNIRELLVVDEIDGDANLREMNGRVSINHVSGDLIASEIAGTFELADVRGDAIVSLAQAADLKLIAKGDIVLRLPENIDAEIELDAPHGDLIAHHDIQIAEEDERHLRGTIGNGGVKIQVESTHGDLILEGQRPMRHSHFEHMGQDIAEEVHASVRASLGEMPRGHAIAEQVRESVRASLGDWKRHGRHRIIIRKHHHPDEDETAFEEPIEETPPKPTLTSAERQAILDAIARGELSVDDAIKKLRGEM